MSEPKITLTDLSVNDMNVLLAGLGKLPLDAAYPVFMKVKAQAEAQINAQKNPTTAAGVPSAA
jgi:hypothetical protein